MKNRIFAILIAMAMLISLCACGGDENDETGETGGGTAVTETKTTAGTEKTSETEEPETGITPGGMSEGIMTPGGAGSESGKNTDPSYHEIIFPGMDI